MKENILLIEDEETLRISLRDRLRGEGYVVDTAVDGEEGFEKASALPFDLLILDVVLPYRSGFDLCREIRQAGVATPILFLTAKHETIDKVVGFKIGGDDYVTKPFEAVELIARIEALLRRAPVHTGRGIYQIGSIHVDIARRKVMRDGKPVYLSGREFQLLRYFMERPGTIISRAELLRAVWGYDAGAFTRTVDVHVFSLRHKLETEPSRPELIVTIAGVGYTFAGSRDA